jgi:Ca-activated chloride channel family protein
MTNKKHASALLGAALLLLGACDGGPEEARPQRAAAPPPAAAYAAAESRMTRLSADAAALAAGQGDRYRAVDDNAVKRVAEEPVSTFRMDVDTASYANVRRFLDDGVLPPRDAVRIEEMLNYFDYAYALPEDRAQPFRPTVAVYDAPWRSGAEILHIGVKAFDAPRASRPRLNLVFLVDVSGSMASEDRLPLLKRAFRLLADELDGRDRVSIVTYANGTETRLAPTSGAERARIREVLDGLTAGGGTNGGDGIQRAYDAAAQSFDKDAVNRVILATDGDFNVGITDPRRLEDFIAARRKDGIYLSVLGVGRGNLNDALMQRLARAGNGNASYIDSLREARKVLRREAAATLFPVADDVKLQVEFNPAAVAEYRLIGYETRQLRREDFRNDAADGGEIGAGKAVTALYEIVRPQSPARLLDEPRYGGRNAPAGAPGELAFLKIRYKLPGEAQSRLIERPITDADRVPRFEALPDDLRFAAAVAGFGQILRADPRLAGFTLADARRLAEGALGRDPHGYRRELVDLVETAEELSSQRALR